MRYAPALTASGMPVCYLAGRSTEGLIARICAASCDSPMVGEATTPNVSPSAQVHSATLPAALPRASTQAACPARDPGLVAAAPLNWAVKLEMNPAGD